LPISPASCRRAWHSCRARLLAGGAALLALLGPGLACAAGAQQDPELRAVVQQAIAQAQCFDDQYDSAVWYTLMEPRLRGYLPNHRDRLAILRTVYCETHRANATPLPPGLVLAVLDVESHFNRWAVSSAGAVGLMQVMPFWPEQLGMNQRELVTIEANIRMGCAILRHYLQTEHNDVRRALGRYNGTTLTREYPDKVVTRWTRYWNGADDLGHMALKRS
jgi:soluble lytic murein transglycosylase-like protein